jgi:hypothetical protein
VSVPTVNPTLTPNRPNHVRPARATRGRRNVVENDDYAAFTRRIIAAHGRRIAGGDIEGLATLAGLADDINAALHHAVTGLRAAGFSWADIATRLGTTRQAAHQRFGDK